MRRDVHIVDFIRIAHNPACRVYNYSKCCALVIITFVAHRQRALYGNATAAAKSSSPSSIDAISSREIVVKLVVYIRIVRPLLFDKHLFVGFIRIRFVKNY